MNPDSNAQPRSVGVNVARNDARGKVTGETRYGGDLAGSDALHLKVLRSPHPHAELRRIDTAKAEALPGVVAVYTAKDVPGTNRHGLIRRDQEVFATKRVRYTGDAVAMVVAETHRIAERALKLIEVDYDVLPGVFDIDAAMAPGAPLLYPEGNVYGSKVIRKGDAERAFATEAEVVAECLVETQGVDHAFLDIEAGMAEMDGDTVVIHASGQWVHEEARLVALALGLPLERVRIIQPATGGAFGGREDISIQIYLGLAALKLNRPVRIDYDRKESMLTRHKRHPLRVRYRLGAKADGTLVAAEIDVIADKGAYASTGIAVMRKAASHATGPYRIPHIKVDVTGVFTNHNPCGAMRGFGAAQMAIAYESCMNELARKLKLDPVALRRKNLLLNGESITTSQVIPVATGLQCLEEAQKRINWENRSYDSPAPHLKRGYGVSSFCFGLGYGDGFPDTSRARVRFAPDGVLELYTGGVEVGQGFTTAMAQIAAHDLGVSPDAVRVIWADTHLTPEAGSSSATRQTFFSGSAVKIAATELLYKVLDVAATLVPLHPHDLTIRDGWVYAPQDAEAPRVALFEVLAEAARRGLELEAFGIFQPPTLEGDPNGLSPRAFITYLFGAHAAEVLVDTETGEVHVQRIVAVHDVGKAINPLLVTGQIEGGVVQGLGMALMEEIVRRDGQMLNPGFTDYILPTLVDVPPITAVILEHTDPAGPHGARGVGEPPLIGTPPAILGAIADATGVHLTRLPATPERVWRAIQESPARDAARDSDITAGLRA